MEKRCRHLLVEGTCWICLGHQPTPECMKADLLGDDDMEDLIQIIEELTFIGEEEEYEKVQFSE